MATFGKTDLTGAGAGLDMSYSLAGSRFTLAGAGTVSKLTAYYGNVAGIQCALKPMIYTEGVNAPHTLVVAGPVISVAAALAEGWHDLAFSAGVDISAGTYWLCYIGSAAAGSVTPWRNTAENYGGYSASTAAYYNTPADDPTLGTKGTRNYCIYATYTTTTFTGLTVTRLLNG